MSLTNNCSFDWCKSIIRGRDVARDYTEGACSSVPDSSNVTAK